MVGKWNVLKMYSMSGAAQVAKEMRLYNINILGIGFRLDIILCGERLLHGGIRLETRRWKNNRKTCR